MLKKKNRVDKNNIDLIFKKGLFLNSPNLTFKYIASSNNKDYQISFIAPKSVAKLAVVRNKLRRQGYEVLRKLEKTPVGIMGAFIFKKAIQNKADLENEVKNILNKFN